MMLTVYSEHKMISLLGKVMLKSRTHAIEDIFRSVVTRTVCADTSSLQDGTSCIGRSSQAKLSVTSSMTQTLMLFILLIALTRF